MNSVIQVLLHTPHFLRSIMTSLPNIDINNNNKPAENHVLSSFCEMLFDLYSKRYRIYNPSLFRSILAWNNSMYNSFEQQDASMFLLTLFDYFDQCKCNDVVKTLFEGEQEITITGECNHNSIRKETFLTIQLHSEIGKFCEIKDLWDNMLKSEELSDLWNCEKCKKKVKGSKTLKILKHPNILIIELCYNALYEKKFKYHSVEEIEGNTYILYGIIARVGEDLDFGHYYSVVLKNNSWYSISDDHVSELSKRSSKTDNAILLFYCLKKFDSNIEEKQMEFSTIYLDPKSPLHPSHKSNSEVEKNNKSVSSSSPVVSKH